MNRRLRRSITRAAPFAVLLLVLAAALIFEPGFYDPTNLRHVARGAAFLGIVALGQLLVVIVRGLDLSVGAVITATLLLIVELAGTRDGNVVMAFAAVLGMALLIGLTNAVLVVVRRVPAILTTLAMFVLVQGVGLWLTGGRSRGRVPEIIQPLGTGLIGPIPVPVLVFAAFAVLFAVLLQRSSVGRQLYAVGSNPEAAHLAGVPRRRIAGLAFVVCSCMAMVAGIMLSGYVGFYDRTLGVGYDLDSIAAVVLGGAALTGGTGAVGGTVAAVVGLAALDNLLLTAGVSSAVQLIAKGVVLFLAVLSAGWLFTRPGAAAPEPAETSEPRPRDEGAMQ